jgi:hypothetical protein
VTLFHEEELLAVELGDCDGSSIGERVFLRECGEKGFAPDLVGGELATGDGQGKEGEVYGSGIEHVEQSRSYVFDDADVNVGMAGGKCREAAGQKVGGDCRDDAESNVALEKPAGFLDFTLGIGNLLEDGLCARQEALASFGKADFPTETIDKFCAEFVLELADLLGERGLGDVGGFGGAGKTSSSGNGAEVPKLMKFHGGD